jgi:aminomethyltransferase
MQGYADSSPPEMMAADKVLQKNAATEKVDIIDAPDADIMLRQQSLPQPGPEPSPLHKFQPQPEQEPMSPLNKNCLNDNVYELPEPQVSDSEPASEPGAMTHQTLPEALLKTNLASLRFRKSPYFEATLRWGVTSFQPYNHILMPQVFSSEEDECENLRKNVCLWDVSCERQIEVSGEDALELADMLTPRNVSGMKIGEARYVVLTDEEGMVINDPLLLKIDENRYWFSIADQDMLWWIKGLALGRGLKVRVSELDVSPLAVQGPKSLPLMKELFGDWVEELKYFSFRQTDLDGIPMVLCRSGWSPERGYELFLQDSSRGDELWEKVMAAGQKYGIKPGRPNLIRRVEGGMLSFGVDVTPEHNVLELGLPPKWTGPDKAADFLGKAAIKSLLESGGPKKRIVGLELKAHDEKSAARNLGPLMKPWNVLAADAGSDTVVGKVTSLVFSPVMGTHIAIATLMDEASGPGTEVRIDTACGGYRTAVVRKLPFMPRAG